MEFDNKPTCGTCYYFEPAESSGEIGVTRNGACYSGPPHPQLIQQTNQLTSQVMAGTVAVRPPVTSATRACGEWLPSDSDPFNLDDPDD